MNFFRFLGMRDVPWVSPFRPTSAAPHFPNTNHCIVLLVTYSPPWMHSHPYIHTKIHFLSIKYMWSRVRRYINCRVTFILQRYQRWLSCSSLIAAAFTTVLIALAVLAWSCRNITLCNAEFDHYRCRSLFSHDQPGDAILMAVIPASRPYLLAQATSRLLEQRSYELIGRGCAPLISHFLCSLVIDIDLCWISKDCVCQSHSSSSILGFLNLQLLLCKGYLWLSILFNLILTICSSDYLSKI